MRFTSTWAISFLLFITFLPLIKAQNISTSPYNRFGLGAVQDAMSAPVVGMGQTATVFFEADQLNLVNPAALSALKSKKVIIETAATGNNSTFESNSFKTQEGLAQFGYLAIGMNVAKKTSILFSLQRFNNFKYEFNETAALPNAGNISYGYFGKGGFNSVNLAFQRDLGKHWSVGLNSSYLFGSENSFTQSVLADSIGGLSGFSNRTFRISDVGLRFGVMYNYKFHSKYYYDDLYASMESKETDKIKLSKKLKKYNERQVKLNELKKEFEQLSTKKQKIWSSRKDSIQFQRIKQKLEQKDSLILMVGGVFEPSVRAAAFESFYAYTIDNGSEVPIVNWEDRKGRIVLPSTTRIGFSLGSSSNIWKIAADIKYMDFSNYKKFGQSDSLKNAFQFGLGFQWIPNAKSQPNHLKHIVYRVGAFYNSGYIKLRNEAIDYMGVSAGIGFPFNRPRYSTNKSQKAVSMINLAVSVGQMGTVNQNLIKEKFVRLTLSFSLTDDWFQQRQYD